MGAMRTAMINIRVLKIWLGFGEKVAIEGEGGDGGLALSSTHWCGCSRAVGVAGAWVLVVNASREGSRKWRVVVSVRHNRITQGGGR